MHPNVLCNTLEEFEYVGDFARLFLDDLPPCLLRLNVSNSACIVIGRRFPKSLKYLRLCVGFFEDLIAGYFPDTLEELDFVFCVKLVPGVLPKFLKKLILSPGMYDYDLYGVIPDSLTHFGIHTRPGQVLDSKLLDQIFDKLRQLGDLREHVTCFVLE